MSLAFIEFNADTAAEDRESILDAIAGAGYELDVVEGTDSTWAYVDAPEDDK